MPNREEELLDQNSMKIIRDRTLELFVQTIDIDNAYGQMKLSEETSRQCVYAVIGTNYSGHNRFEKGSYGFAIIPTISMTQRKRTETLK